MTLPGGSAKEFEYDPFMRITQITAKDPGQNVMMNYQYTYDKMDNITAKATEHGNYDYGYDYLYRLTTADNPDFDDEDFTYDSVGNRLTSADVAGEWTYNENNELETYDGISYVYDDNGNMTEKNDNGVVTRFFYNVEDRLERVEDGSGNVIATYYYDPFGRRLWKDVSGVRTYFHYADEGLIGEYDGAGVEIKTYGWKPGSTWSTDPLFMKVGGQYYWYHNDHIGTPQKMTAINGAVVWAAKYESFGKAVIEIEAVVNNLRFPGQYEDQETGMHYNHWRYYDSSTGRYLTPDPIGLKGGLNLFLYTQNNSVNGVDPSGLEAIFIEDQIPIDIGEGGTLYAGYGVAAFLMGKSGTGSVGMVIYAEYDNPEPFYKSCSDEDEWKNGFLFGLGHGYIIGIMTGSKEDFYGKVHNVTLSIKYFEITYSINDAGNDGISISFGGKGKGIGYYFYEAETTSFGRID